MADQKVLRFIARGRPDHLDYGAGPMVAHYDRMLPKDGGIGQRAFLGRRLDPTQGVEFDHVDPATKQLTRKRHGVFVPHDESGEVLIHDVPADTNHLSTYIREAQQGQILPADEFTAKAMGLPWDPAKGKLGGHYEKSAHAAWVKEQAVAKAAEASAPAAAPPPAATSVATKPAAAEPAKGAA